MGELMAFAELPFGLSLFNGEVIGEGGRGASDGARSLVAGMHQAACLGVQES